MKEKNCFSKFMLLWGGELLSAVGSGLTSFGLGVYVFRQTGSAGSMALVTLLAFLPTLLLSVPAGVLADRYDRRLLMMLGDGCSALGILYILLCMMRGEAELWQICLGVFVSSAFSALLEPSYRATVTDLLTKEEYSKASGLVSLASSARYLISPALAGALLTISDIKLLLLIDICTFFPTVLAAAFVRKGIATKEMEGRPPFGQSLRQGWGAITGSRGILILVAVSSAMTCFMGCFQILAQPLILDFADSATLGIGETVCACGMLVSALFLGEHGSHLSVRLSVLRHAARRQQLPGLSRQSQYPQYTAGPSLGRHWFSVPAWLCGGLCRSRRGGRRHCRRAGHERGAGSGGGGDNCRGAARRNRAVHCPHQKRPRIGGTARMPKLIRIDSHPMSAKQ